MVGIINTIYSIIIHFLKFLLKPLEYSILSNFNQDASLIGTPFSITLYHKIYTIIQDYFNKSPFLESCNFSNINLDLTEDLFELPEPFLNKISESKLQLFLSRMGIFEHLNSHGFYSVKTKTETKDTFVHRLKIVDSKIETTSSPGNFLLDIWLRRRSNFQVQDLRHMKKEELSDSLYSYLEKKLQDKKMTLVVVEWICLQNPLANFSSRPQLPGQHFPGLRLGRKTERFLEEIALEVNATGLICLPEHFHNAFLNYRKGWRFFNPAFQGWFESLLHRFQRQLSDEGHLAHVAWAIQLKLISNPHSGLILTWNPQEQMFPLGICLREYFNSDQYLEMVSQYKESHLQNDDWSFDAKNPSLEFLGR